MAADRRCDLRTSLAARPSLARATRTSGRDWHSHPRRPGVFAVESACKDWLAGPGPREGSNLLPWGFFSLPTYNNRKTWRNPSAGDFVMGGTRYSRDTVLVPLEEDTQDHLATNASRPGDPIARPDTAARGRILWPYALTVLGFHLLLPLACVPWLFSWTGLLLIPLGNYLFCSLGIGAGFHRLLTHRSFRCPRWLEHLLALLGVCSLQDSPARWVMVHRMHHQHSDKQPDPH